MSNELRKLSIKQKLQAQNALLEQAMRTPLRNKLALIGAAGVPVVSDVAGLAADAMGYAQDPASRTAGNFGLTALGALPFVPSMTTLRGGLKPGTKLFRAHADEVSNPNEGAIFFSPDRSYVENYLSDDRRILESVVPEKMLDVRSSKDRARIALWLRQKLQEVANSGGPDSRDAVMALRRLDDSEDSIVQGLAIYTVAASRANVGRIVPGYGEKRLMEDFGADAMTMREASGADNYSVAFKSLPK